MTKIPSIRKLSEDKTNGVKRINMYTCDVDQLVTEDGANIRHDEITPESVADMVAAIRAGVPMPPIEVVPMADGRLSVRKGFRRTAAYRIVGDIRPLVREMESDDALRVLIEQYGENQNEQLNAVDLGIVCQRGRDLGLTVAQMSEQFSLSESSVTNYLMVHKMSEELKRFIIDGVIAYDKALKAVRKDKTEEYLLARLNGGEVVKQVVQGGYKPSMGKSVVRLFNDIHIHPEGDHYVARFNADEYAVIQEAIDGLNRDAE